MNTPKSSSIHFASSFIEGSDDKYNDDDYNYNIVEYYQQKHKFSDNIYSNNVNYSKLKNAKPRTPSPTSGIRKLKHINLKSPVVRQDLISKGIKKSVDKKGVFDFLGSDPRNTGDSCGFKSQQKQNF